MQYICSKLILHAVYTCYGPSVARDIFTIIVGVIHAYRKLEPRSVILLGNHTKPASSARRVYQDETRLGPLIILRAETYIAGVDGEKNGYFFRKRHLR